MDKIENKDILNLQYRKLIYNYIDKFPGVRLSVLVKKKQNCMRGDSKISY